MRDRIIAIVVIVALAAGATILIQQKRKSPTATRERMVEQFIAILPDSLDDNHILEIRQLFYTLREREKIGKVKPETMAAIDTELAQWVEKGKIGPRDLIHFMAEVGYSTYKDDEKYNLPDGSVDHPVLNPNSALIETHFDSTQVDSALWHDFQKWRREHPEEADSLMREAQPNAPGP